MSLTQHPVPAFDWLRGRENLHKRYLLHVAGHNLSLLMHELIGAGTPREAVAAGYSGIFWLITPIGAALFAVIGQKADQTRCVAIIILEGADC